MEIDFDQIKSYYAVINDIHFAAQIFTCHTTIQNMKPSKIYVLAGIKKAQIMTVKGLIKTTQIVTISNKSDLTRLMK